MNKPQPAPTSVQRIVKLTGLDLAIADGFRVICGDDEGWFSNSNGYGSGRS